MRLWLARICAVTIGVVLVVLSVLFALIQNP